ncbi:Di-copper centre-containing protein [Rhizodiscina lignyota]|uniref:tyrosinase n=1 Tax=Rhizodiscina lignyota TaxID=1504668 RepID=A0A9P4IKI1_9PEZI|nr:Di-copper centre-containing protein [Rhizodiscina lignyota]
MWNNEGIKDTVRRWADLQSPTVLTITRALIFVLGLILVSFVLHTTQIFAYINTSVFIRTGPLHLGEAQNQSIILGPELVTISGERTGFNSNSGEWPPRLEFAILESSGPAFDLYLQCQHQFMTKNESDTLSFYQIAGIHGRPYKEFNGVKGNANLGLGYCKHNSALFLLWHRAYVALYEQIISECAQSLAPRYPATIRADYVNAAKTLRLPYWDWASTPALPEFLQRATCTVRSPEGFRTIQNPLYQYKYPPWAHEGTDPDLPPPSNGSACSLPFTVRSPNKDFVSQPEVANSNLNKVNFRNHTYRFFTSLEGNWDYFATAARWNPRRKDSLEYIHNYVHYSINGTMPNNDCSAFDPVFWLHHAKSNTDRLLALWQAVFPKTFVGSSVNDEGAFSTSPGTVETPDSPLAPFFNAKDREPLTAHMVRSIRDFGYSYPELQGDSQLSEGAVRHKVMQQVTRMYGA